MGTILIGSIPGVYIGSALAVRLPERGLRPALGIVLLASGLGLLSKAGIDMPAWVLGGAPVVLAAIAFAVMRRRPRGATSAAPVVDAS
jgi:hypothetical protein